MKKSGPSYRYLHLSLGILAVFLVILALGLIWVYGGSFPLDLVTIVWIGVIVMFPIIQIIGGLGYAGGKEWGRRLVDRLALAIYLIAALLAGRLFFVAIRLSSRVPPPTETAPANPFLDLSFWVFFSGVFLVLVMLFEVLLRGVLWKPEVMLFFKPEAAREDLRARLLRRMGLIGGALLVLSFGASWIWPNLPI